MKTQTAEELVKRLDVEARKHGAPELRLEYLAARAIHALAAMCRAELAAEHLRISEPHAEFMTRANARAVVNTLGLLKGPPPQ